MAITEALLTAGTDTTGSLTYVTASVAPTGDALLLLAVVTANTVETPTVTGNGLTWVLVDQTIYSIDVNDFQLFVFRTMGASPSAGAVTITFASDAASVGAWVLSEFEGVDTSGSNGSGAVVQAEIAVSQSVVNGLTVTLDAFASATNAAWGTFSTTGGAAKPTAPGAGFTEIAEVDHVTPQGKLQTEWRADADTTVDATWDALAGGAVAVEIAEAEAGTSLAQGGLIFLWGPAASAVTGTLAISQAAQTSTASGTVELPAFTGTFAVTQADQTSSASGTVALPASSGTLAVTQAAQTSDASGTVEVPVFSGISAAVQADQVSDASGTFTGIDVAGTSAIIQDAQTSDATGTVVPPAFTGTSANIQANQTSTAAGTVEVPDIAGTLAVTQADQTSTASGTADDESWEVGDWSDVVQETTQPAVGVFTGTLAENQENQVLSAAGTVESPLAITGTAGLIQDPQTVTAAGTFGFTSITGALAVTQDDQTLIAVDLRHPPGPATAPLTINGVSQAHSATPKLGAVLVSTGRSVATSNTGKSTAPGPNPESEAD